MEKRHCHLGDHFFDETAPHPPKIFSVGQGLFEEGVSEMEHGERQNITLASRTQQNNITIKEELLLVICSYKETFMK